MIYPSRRFQRFLHPWKLAAVALLPVSLATAFFLPDEPGTDRKVSITPPLPKNIPTNGHTMGVSTAPVQVVEWADYQCPFCGAFARTVQPELVKAYVATGKVCFEYQDFAFLGPESVLAAEAADCAMDQGNFWQYHDSLFANQGAENSGAFSPERLGELAAQMGLDTRQFSQCLTSGSHREAVLALRQDGIEHGIHGTPSLIVNGQKIVYQGWDSLQYAIDAALAAS
jgi:protein-disulfide isomerase